MIVVLIAQGFLILPLSDFRFPDWWKSKEVAYIYFSGLEHQLVSAFSGSSPTEIGFSDSLKYSFLPMVT
jgi:hypothetical protein